MILNNLDYSLTPNVRFSHIWKTNGVSLKDAEKRSDYEHKLITEGKAIFVNFSANFVTDEPLVTVKYKSTTPGRVCYKEFRVSDILGLEVTDAGNCIGYKK